MTDTELLEKLERVIKQRGSVTFEWVDNEVTAVAAIPVKSYFADESGGKRRTGDDIREFLGWIEEAKSDKWGGVLNQLIATKDALGYWGAPDDLLAVIDAKQRRGPLIKEEE